MHYFSTRILADLVVIEFEPNPYEPSVVNKIIDGKQMTTAWHENDQKVSQQDTAKIDELTNNLALICGKITVNHGGHDYFGMMLDNKEKGKCNVTIKEYTKKILDMFPKDISKTALKPTAYHLFEVRAHISYLRSKQLFFIKQPLNCSF